MSRTVGIEDSEGFLPIPHLFRDVRQNAAIAAFCRKGGAPLTAECRYSGILPNIPKQVWDWEESLRILNPDRPGQGLPLDLEEARDIIEYTASCHGPYGP